MPKFISVNCTLWYRNTLGMSRGGGPGVQEADGSPAAENAATGTSTRLCGRRAYSYWGWGLALKGSCAAYRRPMALAFPPNPGSVVICRFPAAGTVVGAEMVKIRPAVVVGRALERRRGLVNVVPISMTAPAKRRLWHVPVSVAAMPPGWREKPGDRWAKCDMLTVVSLERLSLAGSARIGSMPSRWTAFVAPSPTCSNFSEKNGFLCRSRCLLGAQQLTCTRPSAIADLKTSVRPSGGSRGRPNAR
jgi:uncharacterized protein YifN (PemK superfamily)